MKHKYQPNNFKEFKQICKAFFYLASKKNWRIIRNKDFPMWIHLQKYKKFSNIYELPTTRWEPFVSIKIDERYIVYSSYQDEII